VQLEPHDKQWDEIVVQTIKTLKAILGDDVIDIQHIGSTAIPAIKEILNQSWSRVPNDLFIRLYWERPLQRQCIERNFRTY
jgi:hypothetical protein